MTILQPPAYLQGGSYDAVSDRQHLITSRFLKDTTNPSRARGGLLPMPDSWSAATSWDGFSGTLGPFHALVQNTFSANSGDYQVISYDNEVRDITPSSPTTNRIDVIGVQVFDSFYAGADVRADVVVIEGTASAGTPAPPVLPASFEPFYQLNVNSNSTTPVVIDLRRRTALAGAVCPIFSSQLGNNGSHPGEAQLVPSSGVLPARQRVWGPDSAWHGVTPFALDFGSWVISSSTADRAIATLVVPDPGYAYKLVFTGAVWAGIDGNNGWRFAAREGTGSGGTAYAQGGIEIRENLFNGANSVAVAGSSPTLTGSRTVTLWAQRKFGAGTQGCSVSAESELCAMVVPA